MAERGRPVAAAQIHQSQLGGALWVGEGQHHHQQEAHSQQKLNQDKEIKTLKINTEQEFHIWFSFYFHLDGGSKKGELWRLSPGFVGLQDLLDEPLDLPL